MKDRFDVCVFGAGPAGMATAARLADLGLAVIVLDRPPRKLQWRGESFTGAIRQPLQRLGLWETFCAAGHVAGYEQRAAWGGPAWDKSSVLNVEGNLWHVDRDRFDSDLRGAVRERGVPILNYRNLGTLTEREDGWLLRPDDRPQVSCRFLVDATGRASAIARRLGATPRVYDRLIAYTALLPRNENPDFDHTMVIETTRDGWWYAAPVPQGHVLAFFTDADLAPRELGGFMRAVPAHSSFTQPETCGRWLTAGDACAAHDPLCGWGVYRAMSNGILAAEAISSFLRDSDASLLQLYHQHCRKQFESYLEGLTKHYSHERRFPAAPFWQRRSEPWPIFKA
ncbi:MAG TPA: FAD-dependent monooxygenase [Vicinamibacterales bacterium]